MIEYMIGAAVMVVMVVIVAVLLYTLREHGSRVLNLAASEYP